ncbi:Beta-galactosidase [Mactra antiquata]
MGQRIILTLFLIIGICHFCFASRSFGIDLVNDTFIKDGEAFRYISGSIHYSRVPYQYWDDRLHKIAAAGLNAVQTYVPWNAHETVEGVYDFKKQNNIVQFLKIAQKYDLVVILRPGPYICAEWEFGGLPAWLLKYPNMKVRTSDPNYINSVKRWMTALYTEISSMLYKNGGPIITVQIENEYGSYPACDYDYLNMLKNLTQSLLGDDVVLFSTDGDGDGYLKCGTIPGVYATVDFGITYTPEKNFAIQRHKEPHGPLVNSEYYTGWLDHWGQNHSTVPTTAVAKSLDLQLALGANVNMYMFEGGTNFGFWNGANYPYHPVPTSYDYDAPLTEAGDITDKYIQIRNVAIKYNGVPKIKIPASTLKAKYGKVNITYMGNLVSYIKSTVNGSMSTFPLTMENIDHYYGFILYEYQFTSPVKSSVLDLSGVRDRAHVLIGTQYNQQSYGIVDRNDNNQTVIINAEVDEYLYILVENMGRINYGGQMNENLKGIISNVTIDGGLLTQWYQYGVPLSDNDLDKYFNSRLAKMVKSAEPVNVSFMSGTPNIVRGTFTLADEPRDTYLDMSMWTKGVAFINGVNIGRYWPHMGPQVRLYVPKYALRQGENTVSLIEVEKCLCEAKPCYIEFYDTPLINATIPSDGSMKTPITDKMTYRGDLSQNIDANYINNNAKVQQSVIQIIYDWLMVLVDSKWGILLL